MIESLTLHEKAVKNKAKVAIGLDRDPLSAERVINSVLFASREKYVEPVIISSAKIGMELNHEGVVGSEIPLVIDEDPEKSLVGMLKDGSVDAAVRGNMSSKKIVPLLRHTFNCANLCRTSVLEIGGRLVLLAPVGIDEGESSKDLVSLVQNSSVMARNLYIPHIVAVLSGGRAEDRGRSERVDRMLSEAESLTELLGRLGFRAINYGIEIERAIEEGATLLLAPDGVLGNMIFRSLVLVANIESFGACATALPRIYIDTSRAKASYLLPLILASALSKN